MKYSFTLLMLSFCLNMYAQDEVMEHKERSPCKLCGAISYPSNTGYVTPDPIINSPDVWSFVSEPTLHPMKVTVNTQLEGIAPGFVFVAPYTFSDDAMYGQTGSLILDNFGNPLWFRPLSSPNLMNTDFRVQYLKGKPVLTFWQGTLVTPPAYTNAPAGSAEKGACYYILDNTYRVITTVMAKKGYTSDVHEFLITPQNTALFLATKQVPMDLSAYGGPENGFVQNFSIQEVDLKTNKLLFFWSALDHLPLSDSYEPASSATSTGNVWDAFHLNSIGLTEDNDEILFSSRNMWTIYRINKKTGGIVWQLGGKQSDFTFGEGAHFSWQHDARMLDNTTISLFDDNCCESADIPPETPPAHGLIIQIDFNHKTANCLRSYFHNPNLQISSQGDVQNLVNGNKFIGWGASQYYSEYAESGNAEENPEVSTLYDAVMPGSNLSYRSYRFVWKGKPYYPPSIAAVQEGVQTTVYASWNGSTETVFWTLYAGRFPHFLSKVSAVPKDGFETQLITDKVGPYFKVKARDSKGRVIGESKTIKLDDHVPLH